MKTFLCIILVLLVPAVSFAGNFHERSDWEHFFKDRGVDGTIAVFDERSGEYSVYNEARARKQYSPASTFKIPHTLFALDAGVVKDEFQVFPWDGKKRAYESWNKDQNLRSSMHDSVVWVYQQFAMAIGEKSEKDYLKKINYGNADFSGPVDYFWLNESLRISAVEQIEFLQKLYRNQLPFSVEHQRLVKDIMVAEAEEYWILRAKTGNFGRYGWYVGWVEHPEGAVFFALNIDINSNEDPPKRISIVKDVLHSIKAYVSH